MLRSIIGAYAVRHGDPEHPLLADSQETLNKAIALRWIGEWVPENYASADAIRQALLEERWGDAVVGWMSAIDDEVDIYPFGLEIHEAQDYADEEFGPRIQTTPLFREA